MTRAFLLSPRLSDRAAITASNSISNAVPVNLLRAKPSDHWRSTTTTPFIEVNLGSDAIYEKDTLCLGYVNARSVSDKFRFRTATSQGNLTSAPLFDSNTLFPSGVTVWTPNADLSRYLYPHRIFTFTRHAFQWYRIDFDFSSNPLGYVQASRAIVGSRIEPEVSVRPKWSMASNEDVAETVSLGGEEDPRIMGVRRSMSVLWPDLREYEREEMYSTLLERGSAKDVVLAIEPIEGKYAMSRTYIGRVKAKNTYEQTLRASDSDEDTDQRFTVSITIDELAPVEMSSTAE